MVAAHHLDRGGLEVLPPSKDAPNFRQIAIFLVFAGKSEEAAVGVRVRVVAIEHRALPHDFTGCSFLLGVCHVN